MQRMTTDRRTRVGRCWPIRDQRGAVAVIMAFLMVSLIGFAAIAIDVAGMWSERQRLQTGADAAALAIAQDCAHAACGVPAQTATTLAASNFGGGSDSASVSATVLTPSLSPTTGTVTVRTNSTSRHLFAPVLGFHSSTVSAQATATWGAPTGGTAMLPLTFSWCEWKAQTGGGLPSGTVERTIYFTKASNVVGCTGPSNLVVPGGFGWVDPNAAGCTSQSAIAMVMTSKTGASVPSGCSSTDFSALQNKVVLLPIFDVYSAQGNNATYTVYAYAAFRLTGYSFASSLSWNASGCGSGNQSCIKGYFVQYVDLTDAFNYSATAPQLGAQVGGLVS